MKFVLLPIAVLTLSGAGDTDMDATSDQFEITESAAAPLEDTSELLEVSGTLPKTCQDRVRRARVDVGQPIILREPASPEKPMLIWAVDRREDGCGVMVMKGDLNDVREVPETPQPPIGLIPADGDQ